MADVVMPASIPCQFDKRGWRPCKKPSNNGWCTEHEHTKCVVCGEQATHLCEYTGSMPLMCGVPLCETCKHEPYILGEVPFPSKHMKASDYAMALARAEVAEHEAAS